MTDINQITIGELKECINAFGSVRFSSLARYLSMMLKINQNTASDKINRMIEKGILFSDGKVVTAKDINGSITKLSSRDSFEVYMYLVEEELKSENPSKVFVSSTSYPEDYQFVTGKMLYSVIINDNSGWMKLRTLQNQLSADLSITPEQRRHMTTLFVIPSNADKKDMNLPKFTSKYRIALVKQDEEGIAGCAMTDTEEP